MTPKVTITYPRRVNLQIEQELHQRRRTLALKCCLSS